MDIPLYYVVTPNLAINSVITNLYYYRDSSGVDVDVGVLLEVGNTITLFEKLLLQIGNTKKTL